MPPRKKFSESEIITAAFELVRESGLESLTARAIANRLQASTMPIYSYMKNMELLLKRIFVMTLDRYIAYLAGQQTGNIMIDIPLGEMMFAKEEKHLFRALFLNEKLYSFRNKAFSLLSEEAHNFIRSHFPADLYTRCIPMLRKYEQSSFGLACAVNFEYFYYNRPECNTREYYIKELQNMNYELYLELEKMDYAEIREHIAGVLARTRAILKKKLELEP